MDPVRGYLRRLLADEEADRTLLWTAIGATVLATIFGLLAYDRYEVEGEVPASHAIPLAVWVSLAVVRFGLYRWVVARRRR